VFNDFSRINIQLIIGDAVGMERSSQRYFRNQYAVPGYANGGTAKIVDHSKLDTRFVPKPKSFERLEKRKCRFVLVQTVQLDTRWVNNTDIFMINSKICPDERGKPLVYVAKERFMYSSRQPTWRSGKNVWHIPSQCIHGSA
jgi:hypothetical protein